MLAQKQPFIQRVRNSSLVERSCAENPTGLKRRTEAWDASEEVRGERPEVGTLARFQPPTSNFQPLLYACMVGERS